VVSRVVSDSQQAQQRRSLWPVVFFLIALLVAAVIVLIFLRIESWPARTAAQSTAQLERLGRDLRAAFIGVAHLQPKITIKDRVYFEQTTETAELATVSRQLQAEHEFTHTWAGSTKRIRLRGVYVVKAGFDLRKDFSVNVREKEIDVRLPPAQILGVEEKQVEVLTFENGLWNRISPTDIEEELQNLPRLARAKAVQSGLVAEAERTLRERLERRIQTRRTLHVAFATPTPVSSPPLQHEER
jgi:hypothetical protein